MVDMGALVERKLLAGQWWRLASMSLLHAGVGHWGLNLAVLLGLGPFLERRLGSARFTVLYVAAALAGAASSAVLVGGLSVGASGALWGLMTALVTVTIVARRAGARLEKQVALRFALIALFLNLINSFRPGVDWAAHVGGGATGVLFALLLQRRPERPRAASDSGRWGIVALAAAALYLSALAIAVAAGRPWRLVGDVEYRLSAPSGSGVRLELPTTLSQSVQPWVVPGSRGYRFGDGYGPVELALTLYAPGPGLRDERLSAELAALRRSLATLPHGASEITLRPATAQVASRWVTSASYGLANGDALQIALVVEGDEHWRVEAVTRRAFREAYRGVARHVALSLERAPVAGDMSGG